MPDDDRRERTKAEKKEKDDREYLAAMRQVNPLLGAGVQLAAAVVLMFFAGSWLDKQWGTSPWMVFAGLLLGSVAGFFQFFKAVTEAGKREKQDKIASGNRDN